jgi:hypothetical protein
MRQQQALAVSHKALGLGIGWSKGQSVAPLLSGELFMLKNLTVKFNFTCTLLYINELKALVTKVLDQIPCCHNLRSKGCLHTHNSSQSEADNEEDETESTLNKADSEPSSEHTGTFDCSDSLWLHA